MNRLRRLPPRPPWSPSRRTPKRRKRPRKRSRPNSRRPSPRLPRRSSPPRKSRSRKRPLRKRRPKPKNRTPNRRAISICRRSPTRRRSPAARMPRTRRKTMWRLTPQRRPPKPIPTTGRRCSPGRAGLSGCRTPRRAGISQRRQSAGRHVPAHLAGCEHVQPVQPHAAHHRGRRPGRGRDRCSRHSVPRHRPSTATAPAPAACQSSVVVPPNGSVDLTPAVPGSADTTHGTHSRTADANSSEPARPVANTDVTHATPMDRLLSSAKAGNPKAQLLLGLRYLDGDGVAASNSEAVRWLRKAAEQGDAVAQYRLGTMYERGRGVSVDPSKRSTGTRSPPSTATARPCTISPWPMPKVRAYQELRRGRTLVPRGRRSRADQLPVQSRGPV